MLSTTVINEMAEPTYIFRDGHVYAMVDGKVVASVKESEFSDNALGGQGFPSAQEGGHGHQIHDQVEMPPPPAGLGNPGICPNCGAEGLDGEPCPQCGEIITEAEDPNVPSFDEAAASGEFGPQGVPGRNFAKQIVTTPNGLKGRVLARVPSLWGEEVTVRFENGVIKKIPVNQKLTFSVAEETEDRSPVETLQERLAASTLSDKDSLLNRAKELQAIKVEAASSVGEASDEEAATLDRISVEADYELREINDALAHIASDEVEAFEAPAPIEGLPTVEQASVGGTHANWLDRTVSAMVAEANDTDYEKLMDEGPEAFVAGLDDAQLADAKTTRVMASREIRSHTAGADDEIRDKYEKVWLARVEEQRKSSFASRKEEVRKEAASGEPTNAPDESLFM